MKQLKNINTLTLKKEVIKKEDIEKRKKIYNNVIPNLEFYSTKKIKNRVYMPQKEKINKNQEFKKFNNNLKPKNVNKNLKPKNVNKNLKPKNINKNQEFRKINIIKKIIARWTEKEDKIKESKIKHNPFSKDAFFTKKFLIKNWYRNLIKSRLRSVKKRSARFQNNSLKKKSFTKYSASKYKKKVSKVNKRWNTYKKNYFFNRKKNWFFRNKKKFFKIPNIWRLIQLISFKKIKLIKKWAMFIIRSRMAAEEKIAIIKATKLSAGSKAWLVYFVKDKEAKKKKNIKYLNYPLQINIVKKIDSIYHSFWIGKFNNMFIKQGKKKRAMRYIYFSYLLIKFSFSHLPSLYFFEILEYIKPIFKLSPIFRRKTPIMYPKVIKREKQYSTAMAWIKKLIDEEYYYSRRSREPFYIQFFNILTELYYNSNSSIIRNRDFFNHKSIILQSNLRYTWVK